MKKADCPSNRNKYQQNKWKRLKNKKLEDPSPRNMKPQILQYLCLLHPPKQKEIQFHDLQFYYNETWDGSLKFHTFIHKETAKRDKDSIEMKEMQHPDWESRLNTRKVGILKKENLGWFTLREICKTDELFLGRQKQVRRCPAERKVIMYAYDFLCVCPWL